MFHKCRSLVSVLFILSSTPGTIEDPYTVFVIIMFLFTNCCYDGYINLCIVIALQIVSAGKEKPAITLDSHNSCSFHV